MNPMSRFPVGINIYMTSKISKYLIFSIVVFVACRNYLAVNVLRVVLETYMLF